MSLRSEIESRIRDNITEFKEVAGSASLAAIQENSVSIPGCYVFLESEEAGENLSVHAVCQEVDEVITIITVIRNAAKRRGVDTDDKDKILRNLISDQLLNWQPTDYEPILYKSGRLLSFSSGLSFFKSSYSTRTTINSI